MGVKDDLFAVAEPLVEAQGYRLVDLEYVKEGPRWVVRVFLYHPEGIDLEACQNVSHLLSEALDANDPVKTPYHLEVSSPGAERVLKYDREFKIFQGRLVKLSFRQPVENEHSFMGKLGPVTEEAFQLTDAEGQVRSFARDNVKQIRLALESSAPARK